MILLGFVMRIASSRISSAPAPQTTCSGVIPVVGVCWLEGERK